MSVHFEKIASQVFATRIKLGLDDGVGSPALTRSKKTTWLQKAPTGRCRSGLFVSVMIFILFFCLPVAPAQETGQQAKKSRVIVLDPGHGGRDHGASGPENAIEKNIVMAFARAMTARLKTSYRVVLTRRDDYQVALFDRTATANHHRADLFVSIHTGAGYRSNPRGLSVFYYEGNKDQSAGAAIQDDLRAETSRSIQRWEGQQSHLTGKSRYFVELLKKRLSARYPELKFYSGSAPLLVLAGARMPAVLIEIGHVTNPMDAKALKDEAWLTELAGHIGDAIDDFFRTI
jgi:N-acetylmuramoyl-L-alanine amidase